MVMFISSISLKLTSMHSSLVKGGLVPTQILFDGFKGVQISCYIVASTCCRLEIQIGQALHESSLTGLIWARGYRISDELGQALFFVANSVQPIRCSAHIAAMLGPSMQKRAEFKASYNLSGKFMCCPRQKEVEINLFLILIGLIFS